MSGKIEKNDRMILIIDDDGRNVFALEMTLKSHGYKYLSAQTAVEGLEILAQDDRVSLVLMDIMMPEMDGYEAIRMIRSSALYPDVPIVAVTAQAMVGDREKCLEAGASDYVKKPVDVDKLMEIIKNRIK